MRSIIEIHKSFKVLGLNHTANFDSVKYHYRLLSKKYHPDLNKENSYYYTEKMAELNTSYSILKDYFTYDYSRLYKEPVYENKKKKQSKNNYKESSCFIYEKINFIFSEYFNQVIELHYFNYLYIFQFMVRFREKITHEIYKVYCMLREKNDKMLSDEVLALYHYFNLFKQKFPYLTKKKKKILKDILFRSFLCFHYLYREDQTSYDICMAGIHLNALKRDMEKNRGSWQAGKKLKRILNILSSVIDYLQQFWLSLI